MPVDGPRNQRFDGDSPKTLHGIAKLEMFLVQAVDPQGYRRIILVGKIPNDEGQSKLVTFQDDFWDNMGVPPKWLDEKIREAILPDEQAELNREEARKILSTKKVRPEQLRSDDVDVMGV